MTLILILVFTGAGLLAGLITGLCIAPYEDIARHWYEQEVVTAWDKKVNQLEAESLTRENEIKRLYATLVQLREDQKYSDMSANHAEQKAAQRDAAYTALARECEELRAANRALCDKYNELLRNQ